MKKCNLPDEPNNALLEISESNEDSGIPCPSLEESLTIFRGGGLNRNISSFCRLEPDCNNKCNSCDFGLTFLKLYPWLRKR